MTCSILVPAALAAKITRRLSRLATQCGLELALPSGITTLYRLDRNGKVDRTRAVECARVTLGELPRTNGFAFVGKLTHTAAGNIIALAPGEQGFETPEEWRTCKPKCDHCATVRRRSETFLIRKPDGSIVRVGRNCLADFIAGNPASFIALAAFQDIVRDLGDGDGESFGGGGYAVTTEHYLACAVSSVAHHGFFKRGGEGQATAEHAAFLAGPAPRDEGKMREAWTEQQPTEAHIARAAEVRAWLTSNDDRSDYIHNLRVAAAGIVAEPKLFGILASAPQAYNRAMGQIAERAARAAAPDAGHLGEVGKRLDFTATVVRVKAFETMYGPKLMIALRTDAGHEAVTFTTGRGCSANDIGKVFEVRGTVKRHTEYQGRAQTELSRCAFAEAVPA